ncbi:MAG: 4Fe-4S dicluster domain-containing protein [Acidobacteriota bacterium]|jgi:protein NrfC|nr:4Fe-4S dicluster domain-containing protein [Acidobacteriota bacterium]
MAESIKAENKTKAVARRDFLTGGAVMAAGALATVAGSAVVAEAAPEAIAPSTGYIVYDSRVCFGCQSCMYACSLTHEGIANPSLSRIQIIRDAPSFTKYPLDVIMSVCRQCVTPICVQNCPVGACHVDTANGNIRRINQDKCIGCQRCIQSCPQRPHRTVWNAAKRKSSKCDLCADAPYWNQKGGPDGKQACIESCAAKALKLVHEAPPQTDVAGYDVNLAPAPKVFPKMAPKGAPKTPPVQIAPEGPNATSPTPKTPPAKKEGGA